MTTPDKTEREHCERELCFATAQRVRQVRYSLQDAADEVYRSREAARADGYADKDEQLEQQNAELHKELIQLQSKYDADVAAARAEGVKQERIRHYDAAQAALDFKREYDAELDGLENQLRELQSKHERLVAAARAVPTPDYARHTDEGWAELCAAVSELRKLL